MQYINAHASLASLSMIARYTQNTARTPALFKEYDKFQDICQRAEPSPGSLIEFEIPQRRLRASRQGAGLAEIFGPPKLWPR